MATEDESQAQQAAKTAMEEIQVARGAATGSVVASTNNAETSSEFLETTEISTNETDDTDRTQLSRQDQTTPAKIEAKQLISVNTVNKQTIGFPDVFTHKIRFRCTWCQTLAVATCLVLLSIIATAQWSRCRRP
jgi:formylmethanofuran:tetrahydromethanopterin formyltransferase